MGTSPAVPAAPAKPVEIQFLFRFRDLVADTLSEHERLIADQGSCWWGWWKRPSESYREAAWQTLREALRSQGEVPVGLFDSGTGRVHVAWISDVIVPDKHSADGRVDVPDTERKLIPSYYRESPFSRAWMRIVRITRNMDFFGAYSFANAPILPNYDAKTLNHLRGKVIQDADELRSMDTTIWMVRPRQTGDLQDKVLLTIPAVPTPVSFDVIQCDSNLILHLSDIHFALGSNRKKHVWRTEKEANDQGRTLVEAIDAALKGKRIGLLLITGDLTFIGSEEEFNEALASIRLLLGIFNLSADQVVIIPGNHDIRWTNDTEYKDDSEVVNAPPTARANYARFYEQLYRHAPNEQLSMGRRFLLPNGMSIEICALNSSSLETGRQFLAGVGRVNEAAVEDIANELRWKDRSAASMAIRILMIHHHLALTEDLEPTAGYPRGFGLALDAPRILRMAAAFGIQLALHGHKHRAFLWRSFVFELPENTRPNYFLGEIAIIGAGSAGSIDTDAQSNYFNLLDLQPHSLLLDIYRSKSKGVFQSMQKWKAPLSMAEKSGELRLGVWELQN